MDPRHRRLTISGRPFGTLILSLGAAWWITGAAFIAQADVRVSVKRGLPATVCVEWHDAAKGPPATPTVPQKAAPNQFNMATGTIVSADGLIVTMIGSREGGQYSVKFGDGRTLTARLMVDDRRTGMQLLKVDAAGLAYLIPSNQPAQVGEEVTWTYCLGHKERAAARGMIAATGRELHGMGSDLLQIDVAPPIGSAGAPLVDEEGRLLGIVALTRVGESQRMGFAIPGAAVLRLIEARRGEEAVVVQRGMLGIALSRSGNDGPIVARPTADSPALAAGIREGDEVLAIDGAKVGSPEEITRRVGAHTAGQKVKVTIRRDGAEHEFDVTLATPTAPTSNVNPPGVPPSSAAGGGKGSSGGGSPSAGNTASPVPGPAVPVQKPFRVTAVKPDSIYILDAEGHLQALPIPPDLRASYEALYKSLEGAPLAVPSIQVQRSDVEKKLGEIGRDVVGLRQQMEKLTEELQRLQKQLPGGPAK